MAYETFTVYGKSVQINVAEENKDMVETSLNEIKKACDKTSDFGIFIDKQIEEIPVHPIYKEKDELGENVEEYLNEVKEKVKTKMVEKLDAIESKRDSIIEKAYEEDKRIALEEYKRTHPEPKIDTTELKKASTTEGKKPAPVAKPGLNKPTFLWM